MSRLLLAHVLRLIAVVCLTVAIVISVITLAGLGLALTGKLGLRGVAGELVLIWAVALAVLLSVSRLAYIALGRIVDLGPR